MTTIISMLNFFILSSYFYMEGWFDGLDPTSDVNFTWEAVLMAMGTLLSIAFIGMLFGKVFEKFIVLGPMLLGAILSYFIIVQLLLISEGTVSFFNDVDGEDALGPKVSVAIVMIGTLLGVYAGAKSGYIIIYLTSAFMASYCIVRGVSLWCGKFMKEVDMVKGMFTSDEIPPISPTMMFYSLAIFVIWLYIAFSAIRKQSK